MKGIERPSGFAVDAQHLMGMAILGFSDEAFFNRRRPAGVANDLCGTDAGVFEFAHPSRCNSVSH